MSRNRENSMLSLVVVECVVLLGISACSRSSCFLVVSQPCSAAGSRIGLQYLFLATTLDNDEYLMGSDAGTSRVPPASLYSILCDGSRNNDWVMNVRWEEVELRHHIASALLREKTSEQM